MRKLLLLLCLLFLSATFAGAADYYLAPAGASPAGNDANAGTSARVPWLTPNHALNCGDKIHAIAGTYAAGSFSSGRWGTVTCAAGNNVAWVWCDVFDTCKISASSVPGMFVSKSYWGVQGWEVTTSGSNAPCFLSFPLTGSPVHHLVFANNVANGCVSSGFTFSNQSSTNSEDYLALVGNIIYNATTTTAFCDSGITIYTPIKTDSLAGTHLYMAGNFSFDNLSGFHCAGGTATYDGNGIVLDDIGGSQQGATPYDQQIVIENNIVVWNGGYGTGTTGGGTPSAPIYIRNNTSFGNLKAVNNNATTCGDLTILADSQGVHLTEIYNNIVQTNAAKACSGGSTTLYAVETNGANGTDHIYNNWLYSATGSNTLAINSTGFSFGPNNTTGISPAFANPADPGAPNCTGKTSTVDCMSTVIANYTPTTVAARVYGYQLPSTAATYDPLFPQWLCNVGLPSGLVDSHCVMPAFNKPNPPVQKLCTITISLAWLISGTCQ